MKYYRKQPVEAIQWNGDDQMEVSDFILKVTRTFATKDDGYGNLNVCYMDGKKRKHVALIPKFGWVVIEGKILQFYKDETFKKTFKAAEEVEDESAGIDREAMDKNIKDFFESFDKDKLFKVFHGIYKEKIQDAINKKASEDEGLKEILDKYFEDMAHSKLAVDYFGAPAIHVRKDVIDAIKEEARAANIKNRAQSLADFLQRGCISREEAEKHLLGGVTFDSVLDEMKELHAKKNKDYKGSFHDLFKEYGMPYALGHLEEKLNRVKAITENGGNAVKNDHIEDSVIDLACYAVMLYVELKNKKNGTDKD